MEKLVGTKFSPMVRAIQRLLVTALLAVGIFVHPAHAVLNTDYYQAGSNMWVCSSSATASLATAAGTSVTSPLALWNPSTSTVRGILLETTADFQSSPAAAAGLYLAFNLVPSTAPTGTAGTVTSSFVGKSTNTLSTAQLRCFVGATLPAVPTAFRWIGGTTGAAAISGLPIDDKPSNDVIIPPGAVVSLQTTSAANVSASFFWFEFPQ